MTLNDESVENCNVTSKLLTLLPCKTLYAMSVHVIIPTQAAFYIDYPD